MVIIYIISIFQSIVWLLPIFKQWKSPGYKNYFLILGLQDGIVILCYLLFGIGSFNQYVVWAAILLISFLPFFNTTKRVALLMLISLPFMALTHYLPYKTANLIILIQYSFVFLILMRKFVTYFTNNHIILLFHSALIFYMFANVLKLFILLIDVKAGLTYYMITTFIQIFFGIYFITDSDQRPRFILYSPDTELNKTS
ncbi:MAG: hypothetical protein C4539_10880 [Ignavibacteriales bacterium]|nr:MAG: hypothetical protein C4539_10880 [Ignavibacteriales bacterium]